MLLRLLVCLALAAGAASPTLTFKNQGETVRQLSLAELIQAVPSQEVHVYEPHEKRERRYKVLPLDAVLKTVFGQIAPDAELMFRCTDGYQPTVPMAFARSHQGYLAYASADGLPFRLQTEHQGDVEAGPLYLIWDNRTDKTLQKDDSHFWPYQVEEVWLIRFADRFDQLLLPPGASPAAERGFEHYRRLCMMCHSINGQGGIQAELNYPLNVTEYWKEDMLARWIEDPASVRHGSLMPPLPDTLSDKQAVARDIVEYLKAIKVRKKAET